MKPRICVVCSATNMPRTGGQKACGPACSKRLHAQAVANKRKAAPVKMLTCVICSKPFPQNARAITCGAICSKERVAQRIKDWRAAQSPANIPSRRQRLIDGYILRQRRQDEAEGIPFDLKYYDTMADPEGRHYASHFQDSEL
ncbi:MULTISPECIES: hypothetical protein [Rhodopseudomonas]|uniref:hypothetical protein n=1 Tax=Rhodopseudomonas TaxID=1073 RepID=UPI00128CA7E4|nr:MULTISPECIES: hypothetical protein [Rhodopseudomonas]MDF3811051.1 hypothetical protein [Rhodopseudomonas sp. BAL398]WOK15947.1 hypothetical protein RBJ75_17440 [Rhodopseudomonas sp. BAL398]